MPGSVHAESSTAIELSLDPAGNSAPDPVAPNDNFWICLWLWTLLS